MDSRFDADEMVKEVEKKTGIKVGAQIGSASSYGRVLKLAGQPNKVIKMFKPLTYNKGRKEVAISIAMGRKEIEIGPQIYRAGFIVNKEGSMYFYIIMDKLDGDLRSLMREDRAYLEKWKTNIKESKKQLVTKLHKQQIVHGDLRNDNIGYVIVNKNKPPKLYIIDYGFSVKVPYEIKTPSNLVRSFAMAYKDMDITTKNILVGSYLADVEDTYKRELFLNKTLKKYIKNHKKKPVPSVRKLLDDLNNIQNKQVFYPYINIENSGHGTRYKYAERHWVLWDPANVNLNKRIFVNIKNLLEKKRTKLLGHMKR